jgi:hypothetical protein
MIETLAIRLNRPPAAARRNSLFKIAAGMFLSASLIILLWLIDLAMLRLLPQISASPMRYSKFGVAN